ncbi:hypothetical protein IWX65_001001 [Arthrobacter sp. CAN_A214]|uniref:hypothetical protein n=1 Tax=Arthrobacter sp. CAN_A214 TaxID=2787720 RepID=UPI0018CAEB72
MTHDDGEIDSGTHLVPVKEHKWQLQFVNAPRTKVDDELFLVRYVVGSTQECQYRTNGEWLDTSRCHEEDAWFFLIAADDEFSLFDYSQMHDESIGVEVGYLVDQAVEWYDHPGLRLNIAYEVFDIKEQQLYVRRLPGRSDLRVELATQDLLWGRGSGGRWTLQEHLTLRERMQRLVLIEHAEKLIRESNTVRFSHPTADEAFDLQLATAIALGVPFRVIPTFDSMLFELKDDNLLRWEAVRPLLTISAETALIGRPQGDEFMGVLVRSGPHTWIRHSGSWLPVRRKSDHERSLMPLAFEDLMDAVLTWDVAEETKTLQPQRPEFSVRSVYFVTKDDPGEVSDFSIVGLVRGSIGKGYGKIRRGRFWQHGYLPVLDQENHMPTDENDLRPGGGEFLCTVDRDLEPFAIAFWDANSAPSSEAGPRVTKSNFTAWIATST